MVSMLDSGSSILGSNPHSASPPRSVRDKMLGGNTITVAYQEYYFIAAIHVVYSHTYPGWVDMLQLYMYMYRSRLPQAFRQVAPIICQSPSNRVVKCDITNFEIIFIKPQNPIIR